MHILALINCTTVAGLEPRGKISLRCTFISLKCFCSHSAPVVYLRLCSQRDRCRWKKKNIPHSFPVSASCGAAKADWLSVRPARFFDCSSVSVTLLTAANHILQPASRCKSGSTTHLCVTQWVLFCTVKWEAPRMWTLQGFCKQWSIWPQSKKTTPTWKLENCRHKVVNSSATVWKGPCGCPEWSPCRLPTWAVFSYYSFASGSTGEGDVMCFPCCPASATANLCPLASMCPHVVYLHPCLLSVRLFIYDRARLVLAAYVRMCGVFLFFFYPHNAA